MRVSHQLHAFPAVLLLSDGQILHLQSHVRQSLLIIS